MACAKLALSCSGLLSPWAPRRGPRGWWCHGGQLGPGTSQNRGCDQTPQCCPPTSLTHTQGDESPAALGLVLCLVPQTTTFLLPHLFVFSFYYALCCISLPWLPQPCFIFTASSSSFSVLLYKRWQWWPHSDATRVDILPSSIWDTWREDIFSVQSASCVLQRSCLFTRVDKLLWGPFPTYVWGDVDSSWILIPCLLLRALCSGPGREAVADAILLLSLVFCPLWLS